MDSVLLATWPLSILIDHYKCNMHERLNFVSTICLISVRTLPLYVYIHINNFYLTHSKELYRI